MVINKKNIFLIAILLLSVMNCVYSDNGWEGETTQETVGEPREGIDRLRNYVTMMEDTLAEGKVVDFSKDPYKDNPELVLEALKEKYPNLDLNSIKGVKIDGNTLTTSDNSKINLKTGKPITVETDGSKITYFDDGETKILNGVGVEYKAGILKVELADRVN